MFDRWPYNTICFRLSLITAALVIYLLIVTASFANAASLRICFNSVDQDVTRVQADLDASPLYEDILTTSTAQSRCVGGPVSGDICTAPSTCQGGECVPQRCAINPIPPTILRGRDLALTLRAFNALGEGSPASAPVTFRTPLVPGQIQGVTISIVAP